MKNNRIYKILLLLPLATSLFFTTSCKKKNKFNYDNFFGMCEVCGELSNGVDYALTNDAIADKAKAMKCKSFRIWISIKDLFNVDEEDNLTVNQFYYNKMLQHCTKLKDAGVKNFLMMYTTFIYPSDYVPTTGYVVPDPVTEYSTYIRFLNLIGKASAKLADCFPMATIVEPGNEPDFPYTECIHKNGFTPGGSHTINESYIFTDDEKASIIDDMCWYAKKYLKDSGHKDVKVSIPGLTNVEDNDTPAFLDLMYSRIESKCLPAGQEYSDTNVSNYFDYLNWHPYTDNNQTSTDDDWLARQKKLYQVAIDHDDDGRPVLFSEFGSSDFGGELGTTNFAETQNFIANEIYIKGFNLIKRELPMVETVFCFRMFNLVHQQVSLDNYVQLGESNFGLFYNPDDPIIERQCKAKPAAKAIAKYFNGDDYDVSVLDSDYRVN